MITDTNWLCQALAAEIKQIDIVDKVVIDDGSDVDAQLDKLRSHPKTVVYITPGMLECDHRLQGGVPIVVYISRQAAIMCFASKPGVKGGDPIEARTIFDRILQKLTWNKLGTRSMTDVIVLPQTGMPVDVPAEQAPGRACWKLDIKVQCREQQAN